MAQPTSSIFSFNTGKADIPANTALTPPVKLIENHITKPNLENINQTKNKALIRTPIKKVSYAEETVQLNLVN